MRVYDWSGPPYWTALAHAESMERARQLLIEEIDSRRGRIVDGSVEVGDADAAEDAIVDRAIAHVRNNKPVTWRKAGALFRLTDSGHVAEMDRENLELRAQIEVLRANLRDAQRRIGGAPVGRAKRSA